MSETVKVQSSAADSAPEGSLRQVMPVTAEIVDELRRVLGRERADAIVRAGKMGRGSFRAVEVGPDGQRRVFGSFKPTRWPSGGR